MGHSLLAALVLAPHSPVLKGGLRALQQDALVGMLPGGMVC